MGHLLKAQINSSWQICYTCSQVLHLTKDRMGNQKKRHKEVKQQRQDKCSTSRPFLCKWDYFSFWIQNPKGGIYLLNVRKRSSDLKKKKSAQPWRQSDEFPFHLNPNPPNPRNYTPSGIKDTLVLTVYICWLQANQSFKNLILSRLQGPDDIFQLFCISF